MNRLVIIGNGFDMAHGLKTSYKNFIDWYLEQRLFAMLVDNSAISGDCLCKFEVKKTKEYSSWFSFFFFSSFWNSIKREWKYPPLDIIRYFKENTDYFSVTSSKFFEALIQSIETKGWVDIENDYYQLLKRCTEYSNCGYTAKELNEQLDFLRTKLAEYLAEISCTEPIPTIREAIRDNLHTEDLSTEGKRLVLSQGKPFPPKQQLIERTMLLCFNYTGTAKMYLDNNTTLNYIHGELEHPEHIIFGYGDELDKDYKNILDKNDNELLKNSKSSKYLETRNYREMLDFLMAAPFQVLVMGHSCGNSDRTLLNTVFEHENCVSIKPYYHQWEDGSDNYLELVQNISRNFTNMRLFRDRVVTKEQCKTM